MSEVSECLFCRIVSGEIPADKVYEDDHILAFKDVNPAAPVHVLIIPNRHIKNIADVQSSDQEVLGYLFAKAKAIAEDQGLSERGYRLVSNCGEDGGQTVPHLHFHLLGGRRLAWPPG